MTLGLDTFFTEVAAAPRTVLALDYDGTLAPFCARPQDAVPHPGVRPLLERIMAGGRTRVVVVSGRPAREVVDLLGLAPAPEIWGAHGWELLKPDSPPSPPCVDDATADVLARARAALAARDLLQHAQWKAASVAVHWRGRPDPAAIATAAHAALAPLAHAPDFELLAFAAGLELRCRRCHKGTALAAVLAEEDLDTPVAYLGDDLTDEDAFAMLAGRGLAVRVDAEVPGADDPASDVRGAAPARPTGAALTIDAGEGVVSFLARWLAAVSSRGAEAGGEAS